MTWQAIETAPKDGTWIIVYCDWVDNEDGTKAEDWARIVRFNDFKGGLFVWQEMTADSINFGPTIAEHVPTHWMPLPAPPNPAD